MTRGPVGRGGSFGAKPISGAARVVGGDGPGPVGHNVISVRGSLWVSPTPFQGQRTKMFIF